MKKTTDPVRSAIMRAVKSKDTGPELMVRRAVHALGMRFRLHRKDLPGCPDLVLPRHRTVIFVHGCFWHGHSCKRGARMPATNADYWREKIQRNEARDEDNARRLREAGWDVITVWECETKARYREELREKLRSALSISI